MIRIATDGSCIQQGDFRAGDDTPRPGAYGMIADLGEGRLVRRAVPAPNGLIGGMEVSGLLMALEYVRDLGDEFQGTPVLIQCDSQYAVNGYNDWMHSWESKGWRKKGGIANLELWKRIWDVRTAIADRLPKVEWVKAHQNVGGLNDQVDAMVNTCARTQKPLTQYEAPHGSLGETTLPLIPTQAQYEEASAALDRTLAVFTKRPPRPMDALYDARFPRAASPAIPADEIDLGPPWDVTAGEGDVPPTGRGGTEFLPFGVHRHETADGTEILATAGVRGTATSLHRPRRDTAEDVLRDLIAAAGDDAPETFRDLAERGRAILA